VTGEGGSGAVTIERVEGPFGPALLDELARLRIEVFREYPYLYDGDAAYEADYLADYGRAAGGVLVLARSGGEVVGVASGMPMAAAAAELSEPFAAAGEDLDEWFYLGESVLRREFRGRGIGHRFFDEREAHARALGFRAAAFCAVRRERDDPRRPAGHRDLDGFWERRGYRRRPELVARLGWAELDSGGREVVNELVFRTRLL